MTFSSSFALTLLLRFHGYKRIHVTVTQYIKDIIRLVKLAECSRVGDNSISGIVLTMSPGGVI